MEQFEEKIGTLVGDFREKLKSAYCTGYSFFDTDIRKSHKGLFMTASIGIKAIIEGVEVTIGADVKFERGTVDSKPSDRAWMQIDYEFTKGRDCKIQYHDERSNTPGNDKSINGIAISDMLYKVIYNMTAPIFEDSPMPMMDNKN